MLEDDESTFQQQKHHNKITKLAEEEWDQSNLRLVNYAQNSDQMLLLEKFGGLVQSTEKTSQNSSLSSLLWSFSYETPNWIKLEHKGRLNTSSTFPKEVFLKSKDFFFNFGLTQET
jgi:hypothetical protein